MPQNTKRSRPFTATEFYVKNSASALSISELRQVIGTPSAAPGAQAGATLGVRLLISGRFQIDRLTDNENKGLFLIAERSVCVLEVVLGKKRQPEPRLIGSG